MKLDQPALRVPDRTAAPGLRGGPRVIDAQSARYEDTAAHNAHQRGVFTSHTVSGARMYGGDPALERSNHLP